MQRHSTFAVPLGPAHLSATEAARGLDPDALGSGLHGVLHGPLHGPAEGHTAHQLVGHALGDECCVELGLLDLNDVQLDPGVTGQLGETGPKAVGLRALAADDDARTGGVHVDLQLVPGPLDLDAADGRIGKLVHEVAADAGILSQIVTVFLAIGDPAGLPIGGDTEPEAVGVNFLTH